VVHPPAEEADGCLSCHASHAAPHGNLLLSSASTTCLDCHDGDSADFAEKHLGFTAESMNCGECHDPHASRVAGMLLPEMHMPFADGDCSMCHEGLEQTSGGNR
jgi:predicted CXXCH cytochrome family protein